MFNPPPLSPLSGDIAVNLAFLCLFLSLSLARDVGSEQSQEHGNGSESGEEDPSPSRPSSSIAESTAAALAPGAEEVSVPVDHGPEEDASGTGTTLGPPSAEMGGAAADEPLRWWLEIVGGGEVKALMELLLSFYKKIAPGPWVLGLGSCFYGCCWGALGRNSR